MNKFVAIESLRGWMAWWVLLGHAVHVTGLKTSLGVVGAVLDRGDMAVDVFMIVSGFVITHLMVVKAEPYRKYIVRRGLRLMPLFLTMMAVALATRGLYEIAYVDNPWAASSEMRIARLEAESTYWLPHLLLHLSLLHGLLPDTILPFSGTAFLAPAWSLSLEWQFYLIAPFIIAGLMNWRKSAIVAGLLIVSVPALFGMLGTWLYQPFLPLALPFFFGGIASRLLLEKRIPWFASAATIVATLIFVRAHGHDEIWPLLTIMLIWSLFLIISARDAGVISFQSKAFDALAWLVAHNRIALRLGEASYSTYLCHIPIFAITVGGGILLTGRIDQPFVVIMTGIGIAIATFTSFVLYNTVERSGGAIWNRIIKAKLAIA